MTTTTFMKNPYVTGNPVGGSPAFVGRRNVMHAVLRVLRHPQDNAIVLYGQRRIGKTSILQQLVAQLPEVGAYRPIYFDLQDKAAWPLGRVLLDLARTVAHALDQSDPDLSPSPETTFRDKWLPATLDSLPADCSLVLLFDEFDVLADSSAEQAAEAFFPYLRGLLADDPGRLQFIFVVGRNIDDLNTIILSLFKGTPSKRISLLNRKETADLVRVSENNGSLHWPDDSIELVWRLTDGHPFLTQQLCSHAWEFAYDQEPIELPTMTPADVEAVVSEVLDASSSMMEWLWDGLGSAERVVISALAEAGPDSISQEELVHLLHESGVRIVIRELQEAPEILQRWDLLKPSNGGYRFCVELLRRWIAQHKPLHRVHDELDHIEPVAENLYQAALSLHQSRQPDQAIEFLRRAVIFNPNHLRANLLLAEILLAGDHFGEAAQLLESLHEVYPQDARPRLIQALMAQATSVESYNRQLTLYNRVLELNPTHREATAAIAAVRQEIRRRDLLQQMEELESLERKGQYQAALDLANALAEEFRDLTNWTSVLERLNRRVRPHFIPASIPFVDREDEIGLVLSSYAPPYHLIDAPPGYGKTRLMQALHQRFQSRGWICAYVSVGPNQHPIDLAHALGQELQVRIDLDLSRAKRLGNHLAQALLRERFTDITSVGIALLVDLNEPDASIPEFLLGDLIPEIAASLKNIQFFATRHNRFRVVLGGRNLAMRGLLQKASTPIRVMSLAPFDFTTVQSAATAYLADYTQSSVIQISAHLMYLTGGHPGCLSRTLQSYREGGLLPDDFANEFSDEIRATIVQETVSQILGNIPQHLRDLLTSLSVFRSLSYSVLRRLIEEGLLETREYGSEYDLADRLTSAYLLSAQGRLLKLEPSRRLLVLGLQQKIGQEAFSARCRQAMMICAEHLQNPMTQAPEIWASEYLFQFLQQFDEAIKSQEERNQVRKAFYDELPNVLQMLFSNARNVIEEQSAFSRVLTEDWELRFTVNYYLRKDQYTDEPFSKLQQIATDTMLTWQAEDDYV